MEYYMQCDGTKMIWECRNRQDQELEDITKLCALLKGFGKWRARRTFASYASNFLEKKNRLSADTRIERDVFLYLAYTAQGEYGLVLDEIKVSSPPEIQSVRVIADYLQNPSKRETM